MADVYNYIDTTGVILTDAGVILDQVNNEYLNTFGVDLIVPNSLNPQGASTPQGLLIITETLARIAVSDNNAMLANQINPNLAGGVFLDAILALSGIQRDVATSSQVIATITGVVGTIIPSGSQASDTTYGNIFQTAQSYTIPSGGVLAGVQFYSLNTGVIPCNSNTLTNIISQILGWNSISSNDAAILGEETQTDVQARNYRNLTLSAQGSSTAGAIVAGVLQVPGVIDMSFQENTAATTETINGVVMVSHSIYACVNGGGIGTSTSVIATCTGTPTTIITAGSQVSSNGYVFQNTLPGTIPGGGSVDITFYAVMTGSIPCPPGTLTTIVTPISGWASVTNALQGIIGTESTIAQALVSKKSAGAAYNNGSGTNVQTIVTAPFSNQLMTVLFDTSTPVLINVIVNIKVITPVQNPQTSVQQAILNYAAGLLEGVSGLTTGQNVSSFELAGAITSQYPGIYVKSLYIAYNPTNPTSSAELAIAVYQVASILQNNIVVNIV